MDIYRSTDKSAGMAWSMRSLFAALVLSALVSVSAYSATPGTHSAADLNQNRAAFDGKEVTVRGYLWIGGEQMYLVDRRFDADDAWAPGSGCLSLLNFGDLDEHADSFSGKYVELKGKFVKDNKPYGPSLMVCGATGLDLHANPAAAIRLRE